MSNPYRTPGEVDKIFVDNPKRNWKVVMKELFLGTAVIATALFGVSIVAYPIARCVLSNGEADYCYVWPERWNVTEDSKTHEVVYYTLRQHVPWGQDRTLETGIKTSEDVRKEAEAFKCSLK